MTPAHALDSTLGGLIRALQIRTLPPFEAEVLSQEGQELTLRLLLAEDMRALWELDRGLTAPMALQGGWTCTLAPGARVVVEFLDGDRRKPVVRSILSGTLVSVTLASQTVELGQAGGTVKLAGGSKPVARVGDVPTGLSNGAGPVTGTLGITPPVSGVLA